MLTTDTHEDIIRPKDKEAEKGLVRKPTQKMTHQFFQTLTVTKKNKIPR
jgi:hypothetical protein